MSLDVEKGLVYVPVGNPAPDFYGQSRPGENLYTNAIVALDVRQASWLGTTKRSRTICAITT
jgi:alcohol dehydrogenase (cytochrome c)